MGYREEMLEVLDYLAAVIRFYDRIGRKDEKSDRVRKSFNHIKQEYDALLKKGE